MDENLEALNPDGWTIDEIWRALFTDLYSRPGRADAGLLPEDVRPDGGDGSARLRSYLGHRASFRHVRRHAAPSADIYGGSGAHDPTDSPRRCHQCAAAAQPDRHRGVLRHGRHHL